MTNIRYGLETKIAQYRGELEATRSEIERIETGVSRLSSLHLKITELEDLIAAATKLIQHDHPDAKPERIKGTKARTWKSPFKTGEIGRTALEVLRESGEWLRPRDVAKMMLDRIGEDPTDRLECDKLTNSVGAYFTKHHGDLVESRGDYAKEWKVIG